MLPDQRAQAALLPAVKTGQFEQKRCSCRIVRKNDDTWRKCSKIMTVTKTKFGEYFWCSHCDRRPT